MFGTKNDQTKLLDSISQLHETQVTVCECVRGLEVSAAKSVGELVEKIGNLESQLKELTDRFCVLNNTRFETGKKFERVIATQTQHSEAFEAVAAQLLEIIKCLSNPSRKPTLEDLQEIFRTRCDAIFDQMRADKERNRFGSFINRHAEFILSLAEDEKEIASFTTPQIAELDNLCDKVLTMMELCK